MHLTFDFLFPKFIVQWLVDHPKFLSNPLYIAGDSYAGKIVPIVAQEVLNGNLYDLSLGRRVRAPAVQACTVFVILSYFRFGYYTFYVFPFTVSVYVRCPS